MNPDIKFLSNCTRMLWALTLLLIVSLIAAPDEITESRFFALFVLFAFGFTFLTWIAADGRSRFGKERAYCYVYALLSPAFWFVSVPAYLIHTYGVLEGGKIIFRNLIRMLVLMVTAIVLFSIGQAILGFDI